MSKNTNVGDAVKISLKIFPSNDILLSMTQSKLTVVQTLPELESGGVERGTLEISRHLLQKGHRSIVVSGGGRLVSELEKSGGEHVTWPVGAKSPRAIPCVFALRSFLVREKVDVLHLRSRVPAWIGLTAVKTIPKSKRPALVTTFHGFYSVHRFSAVMTKGDKVIAISKTIADHIQKEYGVPGHRLTLIHRGFDEETFDPDRVSPDRIKAVKRKWGLEEDPGPVIILPGRLTRWKGQDVFIKSLARLDPGLAWRAVCVGDVRENPAWARTLEGLIRRHDLSGRVILGGHCADMPAALMAADIVVSASSTQPEAFGRVAVEAQAMARPIIATAHGGSLETVKDRETGRLVPPEDVGEMAGALSEVLSDRGLREAYGKNGQKRVRRLFTARIMCEKTLEVYHEVVS
ncbi:Glycosyl transferase, group 1 [Candidatus Desulfarcum epimagneticum]|uniref:Glycosyl transferase, group 1 n=1 Tax=uncultured Desulfobacteraceae bacterium TaxID=218296 RepID=A0A484HPQ9_9BACT|nr:Glycosyl transferase, group 1 [uncultured Desulfobacteraceae bacterium]